MRLLVSSYLLSRTFNLRFYVFIVAFVFAAAVYTTMTLAGGSTAQMTEQKLLVEEEPGPTSPLMHQAWSILSSPALSHPAQNVTSPSRSLPKTVPSVSYTHLRAHETKAKL